MSQKKSNKKKIIIRTVVLGLVGLVFGLSVYTWNAKSVLGDQMPMPLGLGASVVLSGSMEPELSVDDLVIIKKTDEVEVNDIVVFQEGRSLVIHRVIEVGDETVTTKGDANNTADAPISKESIKGVMIATVPKAGIVLSFLRQPIVIILLLGLALYLCERSVRKDKKSDQDELSAIEDEIKRLLEAKKTQETEAPENPEE